MAGQWINPTNWKFKTTMINRLRVLVDKEDSMQEQKNNVHRGKNPKNEPQRKVRGQKHLQK